jgi:hypothetical protein
MVYTVAKGQPVMYCVFIAPGNRKHLPELFKETGGKDVKH